MDSDDIDCKEIVKKYQKILLSDEETVEVHNNVFQYYTLRSKKSNTCLFCKQPKSKNEFINSYNRKTACKTLTIKCIHSSNPCPGWTYTYGVMFNVYNYVYELRKKIEKLKTQIIINKNNVLYGYATLSEATKVHQKLLSEIEDNTQVYTLYLYNLLYYTDNNQLSKDMATIKTKIKIKIIDIHKLTTQDNLKEVVMVYKEIMQLYECIHKLKFLINSVITQHLIKCESSTVDK